ncbi:hypothetical protein SAVCW2_10640 [Streptomyces avermitilis]|uniref:Translation initiation factor IF-3 n=1 Tax=Streptomyces avermitilis TaxID=33903 RepID=A0A499VKI6_STRAX|nr:hypothetical protein SAVMC3_76440 [Streptomyces avermitilis]GDY81865.1 hypothetical protein SAVCW2_10640 [Streptomyces avermitilis]
MPDPQVEAPISHLTVLRDGGSPGQAVTIVPYGRWNRPKARPAVDRGGAPVVLGAPPVSRPGHFSCPSTVGPNVVRTYAAVRQTAVWCYRGGSISTEPRINDRIRVPEVRLVGPSGEQVGIVPLAKALELAQEYDLDLVEVAASARPPVCKLMDYGKFKYESAMKAREARKNQAHTVIKEMKLRPKIDPHDYDTKKGHVVRFLKQGDKVKITIMFRGREQSRPELGYRLLQRLATDVEDLGFVESSPKQDGRNMIMVLGPHKKKTEAMAEAREAQAARKAEAKANPGRSQNAADEDIPEGELPEGEVPEAETTEAAEAPAEASTEA